MKLGLLIFSLFFLSCLGNDWRCRFDFDGDIYDLTPGNSNPDSPNGYLSILFLSLFFKTHK